MAWRATGPGKWHIHDQSARSVKCRLYNFDHDGSRLKPGHKSGLRQKVIPFLTGNRELKANLYGYASSRGNASYNQRLSARRMERVGSYLLSQGVMLSQLVELPPLGESQADQSSPDAEWDRAVMIDVRPYREMQREQPPATEETPPPTAISTRFTQWQIRLVESVPLIVPARRCTSSKSDPVNAPASVRSTSSLVQVPRYPIRKHSTRQFLAESPHPDRGTISGPAGGVTFMTSRQVPSSVRLVLLSVSRLCHCFHSVESEPVPVERFTFGVSVWVPATAS